MADLIARFKGDTSDLENKIGKAAKTLHQMTDAAHKGDGAFINLEKDQLEFVRSLGKLETGAKSAKGTIGELSKAFTDMSAVYNRLSDEEKKDEGGKALRKSLDELKQRIKEGKKELQSIDAEIGNNGSLLDQLSGKFGVNIKQLGGWGAALGAGKVALDVMKDAFFASEANLDEWNRTVYAGESAWDAFLTSINTGDISGFLGKIDSIISAAKDAYNELDRLSTQKAINNPAIKAQEAENERMRAMLRTGRYIAPNDGRSAGMKEGQVLTDAQKKRIAGMLENGMQKLNSFVRSEIEQTTKSIDALYKQQAGHLGMSLKDFKAGTANMGAFDERMEGYRKYMQWDADHTRQTINSDGTVTTAKARNNPYEQYKAWGVFKDDGKLFGQINDLINQRASLQSQNYGNTANAYRAINRATSTGSGKGGTGSGKKEVELDLTFRSKFLTEDQIAKLLVADTKPLGVAVELGLSGNGTDLDVLEKAMGLSTGDGGKMFSKQDFENEKRRGKELADAGKLAAENWDKAANAIGTVGSALQGIENPIAKVTGIIAEAVAEIALTFAKSLGGSMTPWDWIAGAAAGTATMISTISAIKSATAEYHAGGGIVGQTGPFIPRGTDTIPAMLSPQEVVLSAGQASNVADKLQNGQNGGGFVGQPYVQSEMIYLGVNNHLKRTGQGEIVTTKMLKQYMR